MFDISIFMESNYNSLPYPFHDMSGLITYHWEIWVRFSVQYSFSFTFSDFCVPQLFIYRIYSKSISNHSSIPTLFSLTSFLLSHSLPHLPSIACICNWPSKHLPFFSIISLWIDLCSNSNFCIVETISPNQSFLIIPVLSWSSCFSVLLPLSSSPLTPKRASTSFLD